MVFRFRSDHFRLKILLPTGLILSRPVLKLICRQLPKEEAQTFPPQQAAQMAQIIRDYKKAHPDWVLFSLQTEDGESIEFRF